MKKQLFLLTCAVGLMMMPTMAAEEETALGKQMEAMNDAFKGFRRETDPVKGAAQAREAQTGGTQERDGNPGHAQGHAGRSGKGQGPGWNTEK